MTRDEAIRAIRASLVSCGMLEAEIAPVLTAIAPAQSERDRLHKMADEIWEIAKGYTETDPDRTRVLKRIASELHRTA